MTSPFPHPWSKYTEIFPVLKDAVGWERLRTWPLSEVFRVRLGSWRSVIAKHAMSTEARELRVYTDILAPLDVPAPRLLAAQEGKSGSLMLLEDLGPATVADGPRPKRFLEAARLLARIRSASTTRLEAGGLRSEVFSSHYLPEQRIFDDLTYIDHGLGQRFPSRKRSLDNALTRIPRNVRRLYGDVPPTLVHNDYHIKNLVLVDGGITPIDWPGAHLSPHLGDLYTLITEATEYGVPSGDLVEAYRSVTNTASGTDIVWQLNVGGVCWLIRTLRWILDVGAAAVPEMRRWIPDLATDLTALAERLDD